MLEMQSPPGPQTVFNGKSYLYFGGTSYLGLAGRAEVIEAGCAALRQYGVHSATSRSRFGSSPPLLEVEAKAAQFFGAEAAFYFGSGYMTNHILVAALGEGVEAVLVEKSSHYCVLEAARLLDVPLVLFDCRIEGDLEKCLGSYRRVLVMADAVGPSSGKIAPIGEFLCVLKHLDQATLLLDDAHGFGVLGGDGRGMLDEFGLWPKVNGGEGADGVRLVVGGTLSKALGGFGGIIPGTSRFVTQVREASNYFDGASAPGAAVAGSSAKALEIVLAEPGLRERLGENVRLVKDGLRALGLQVPDGKCANFGVSIGGVSNMQRLHAELLERGILLPYVGAYSGIPAEGVLRFAVFANHSQTQLKRLLSEIKTVL